MIAPLEGYFAVGPLASLLVAFALGTAFGFLLERGGLGDAPRLAGQFYLTDHTVLRAMFTAIVTALLGLFWGARLGLLDLAEVRLEATYLLPQLVGGALFGVGFVLAGLCPGTSCVAAVSGKLDGLATLLGIFVGVLIFGETFEGFTDFLYGTRLGPSTLPELSGLPLGVVTLLVVVAALAAFALTEISSPNGPRDLLARLRRPPLGSGGARLAALALVLGVGAAAAGDPPVKPWGLGTSPPPGLVPGTSARYLDPIDLAAWIFERRPAVRVVDLRPAADFDRYHIPGAERLPLDRPASPPAETATEDLPAAAGGVLVVCAPDGAVPAETLAALGESGGREVYLLWGGIQGWGTRVLFPDLARAPTLPPGEADRLARLSRYLGGSPRLPDAPPTRGFLREGC